MPFYNQKRKRDGSNQGGYPHQRQTFVFFDIEDDDFTGYRNQI
jgi:hypothetical protein